MNMLRLTKLQACQTHRKVVASSSSVCCPRRTAVRTCFTRRSRLAVKAQEGTSGSQELGLAPAKPVTPYGEMLQYYLQMEPQLFKAAVEDQLTRLKEEKEQKESSTSTSTALDSLDLALYKRMEEVRAKEVRATLEDLMYISILEKFVLLGVELLMRLDGSTDARPTNLKMLTEGIHSKEALELVREHLMGVMGNATLAQYSNITVKMSKYQMVQVYAASIMFGYFLRKVDKRFQLEKALGTLPPSREEAVERLERLLAQADVEETSTSSGDAAADDAAARGAGASSTSSSDQGAQVSVRQPSALRRYVQNFDQAAMVDMARIVSAEGAALVERQTTALLGDIKKLAVQMQEAIGTDATSMEEVMARITSAVERDAVETVKMTVATQRRAVLEAVAFGTFLRDVEGWVQDEYGILTPLPAPPMPPQSGGGRIML